MSHQKRTETIMFSEVVDSPQSAEEFLEMNKIDEDYFLVVVWKEEVDSPQIKKDGSSSAGDHLETRSTAEEENSADKGLSVADNQSGDIHSEIKKEMDKDYAVPKQNEEVKNG